MKLFTIRDKAVRLYSGAVRLSNRQADKRRACLKALSEKDHYEITAEVGFKVGETFGYAGQVTKAMQVFMVPVEEAEAAEQTHTAGINPYLALDKEALDTAWQQLAEMETTLDAGQQKLADDKAALEVSWQNFQEASTELETAKNQLVEDQTALELAEETLADNQAALAADQEQLAADRAELEAATVTEEQPAKKKKAKPKE